MVAESGFVSGRWTVIKEAEKRGYDRYALCQCACGNIKEVLWENIRRGKSQSCGCGWRAMPLRDFPYEKGFSDRQSYRSWQGARSRCHNPSDDKYSYYGARGIKMCSRWRNDYFEFLKDMGEAPYGLTLERIDNAGDYEPSNCRWATWSEQRNNRRDAIIAPNGSRMSLRSYAKLLGVDPRTAKKRLGTGHPMS